MASAAVNPHYSHRGSYLFMLRRSKLQSRIVLLPHLVMSIDPFLDAFRVFVGGQNRS